MRHPTFRQTFFLVFILAILGGTGYGLYETWLYFRIESLGYDLRSRHDDVFGKATAELRTIDVKRVVPALIRSLPKGDEPTNSLSTGYERVYELLAELTGEEYTEDPVEWRRWEASPKGQKFLGKNQVE